MDMIEMLNNERALIMYIINHPNDREMKYRMDDLEELHKEITEETFKQTFNRWMVN